METVLKADIFFFISSIGFIVLFLLLAIALVYLIKTFRQIRSLVEKINANVDSVSTQVHEFIEGMEEGFFYRLFFRKRKRKKGGQEK